jgi:hypothetical protein
MDRSPRGEKQKTRGHKTYKAQQQNANATIPRDGCIEKNRDGKMNVTNEAQLQKCENTEREKETSIKRRTQAEYHNMGGKAK